MTNRRLAACGVALSFVLTGCLLSYLSTSTTTPNPSPTEESSSDSNLSTSLAPIARVVSPSYSPVPADTSTSSSSSTRTRKQTLPVPSLQVVTTIPIFGVETNSITTSGGFDQISQIGIRWVRRNAVVWSDVEPTQGARVWNALAGLETELRKASSQGIQVILIVRGTPSWAQKVSGSKCGPIRQDKFAAFGNFMHDLVARYNVAPYNVKYWEIWNEPDIDPSLVAPDSVFGCWGDRNDAYYGGGYYATMLKAVYPQMKAADPQAQLMVGGLLLDCDPRPGGGCPDGPTGDTDQRRQPPKFLEGILRGGGAPYLDGVSFHAYDYYQDALGRYGNDNWKSRWNRSGPVMIAKAHFVKQVLANYGVTGKFLMNTESAILCDSCSNNSMFETTKAYYITQVYAAAIAEGLRGNIWYSALGWRNSGLLTTNLTPRPAYTAFQYARSELASSTFVGNVSSSDMGGAASVMGYKFNRGDRVIWVIWSLDGNSLSLTLQGVPIAVKDALGSSVTPSASITVDLKPLYLEWNP